MVSLDQTERNDLIAAVSTASGPGAVGLVRISGNGADRLLTRIFVSNALPYRRPRQMLFGRLVHPETRETVDQVLAVYFPGPASFTGEDSVEIFGHGGSTAPRLVLEAVLDAGARLALPGEFTQRAFLNGKLSLDQAEAVADLVAAQSEAEAALAARHLEGALAGIVKPLGYRLIGLQAELAAVVDFEEEWDEGKRAFLLAELNEITSAVGTLAGIRRNSRIFRDGLRLVLAGPPNAGKSSLFNALLGRDRALVGPAPGTTRDYLEASASWSGLRVELVDTAGLAEGSGDELERMGQSMTARELAGADMVLWLRPLGEPEAPEAPGAPGGPAPVLTVRSKADLAGPGDGAPEKQDDRPDWRAGERQDAPRGAPIVSAKTGLGLDELKETILALAGATPGRHPEVVPNLRQQKALEECLEKLAAARTCLEDGLPPDILALEINEAARPLDCVIGRVLTEDVLAEVFGRFCVGK
ncbi:MAG: tRNA uridine-5-carboxymethylaminomethyl(34) synthesis GTPase MnmE [Deltaproteobacteria bacterium]|jgi:tRNA modification GTPase|nr:tRNA uridine-5-carboxymethylaminomethyl(34) synthesis GTPase MnmE [Deltaproteobacteria bacterium]